MRAGETYHGLETADYFAAAVVAVNALAPDATIVTGDLVDHGAVEEYERFVTIADRLASPYVVIPGNHDDRDALRRVLPPATFGGARGDRIQFAFDAGDVRIVGLDANMPRPAPGAKLDDDALQWLAATLADGGARPTMLAVHQPPFGTGLPYLDVFGFAGARRLRTLVERTPGVRRVISGHVHCVRSATWGDAIAMSAPSTAPQFVPLLSRRRLFDVELQEPGFVVHDVARGGAVVSTVHRRTVDGTYAPGRRFESGERTAPRG